MVIIAFTEFVLPKVAVMNQKSELEARVASAVIRRITRCRKISLKGAQKVVLPSFLTEAHSSGAQKHFVWNEFSASVRPV